MEDLRARVPPRDELFLEDALNAPAELVAVVAAQRSAIARLTADALALPRRRLIGMGSSGFAARDAAARWRTHGLDAVAEVASASGLTPGGPETLAICISASGGTPEVVAAAQRHCDQGSRVLLLTAGRTSALARLGEPVIPLAEMSHDTAGIALQTHRATVSALLLLDPPATAEAAASGVARAPGRLAAFLDGSASWVDAAADLLDTGREVHVLADGLRAGLAEQAALMLREAPRIAAVPFDTGDWLHIGQYTLYPGDAVLLFAGSLADDEAIATIHRRGARVVVVGAQRDGADLHIAFPGDPGDWPVEALVAPAAAELIAAELWSRSSAKSSAGSR
jgi:fructoselysine-6-P-deglycase FrlB-like protein